MEKLKIRGRVWVIRDEKGNAIHNIDTDQIYHNAFLAITDIKEMGKYTFYSLPLWKDFPQKAKKGDILVVGKNFGAGSSRQHAVDCFISIGISAIIGESFGEIYRRNAINAGLPIIQCPKITSSQLVEDGDILEISLGTGKIFNWTKKIEIPDGIPASRVQIDILLAGNLFEYGKTLSVK